MLILLSSGTRGRVSHVTHTANWFRFGLPGTAQISSKISESATERRFNNTHITHSLNMASLLKASNEIHDKQLSKRAKGKGKAEDGADAPMKMRKDKVLLLCSRGVTQRHRHLMHDLEVLLPHTKKGELGSRGLRFPLLWLTPRVGNARAALIARLQARHEVLPAPHQRARRPALM